MPLERAAVAIMSMSGTRPGEARGLRWEDWNRVNEHIKVTRSVWHTIEGTTKTLQSERFLAVRAARDPSGALEVPGPAGKRIYSRRT